MVDVAPGVRVDADSPTAWWLTGRYRYRIQYGGRGSGKSFSCAEALIVLMLIRRLRIACVRRVKQSIKESIYRDMERWIDWRGLHDRFELTRDNIVCRTTGSVAFFPGADSSTIEAIRSSLSGVSIMFIEEAHDISPDVWRILEPSFRPARPEDHVELWACCNPTRETDPVYELFIEQRKGEAENQLRLREVNWRDNRWFPPKLDADRRHDLKHMPRALYEHIWEGKLHPGEEKRGWYPLVQRRHVRACMDRDWWARRPDHREGKPTMGYDVGEPDTRNNAVVVRHGPVVEWAEKFGRESWDAVGSHCRSLFLRHNCNHAFIDSTGVGQGAISQFDVHGLRWHPVRFGSPPMGRKRRWLPGTTNDDQFSMRNIQLAWAVKLRVENTWRAQQGEPIDPRLCMWINPDIPEADKFVAEVAQPMWTQVQGERRLKLDKYGADKNTKSPDYFDALCLGFAFDSAGGLRASDWNVGASDLAA